MVQRLLSSKKATKEEKMHVQGTIHHTLETKTNTLYKTNATSYTFSLHIIHGFIATTGDLVFGPGVDYECAGRDIRMLIKSSNKLEKEVEFELLA